MSSLKNYLRMYRKRSHLTQSDVAFIMNFSDYSNLSRCEKGQRTPSIEMILVYHILFSAPLETLFEKQKLMLHADMQTRIKQLLEHLRLKEKIPKTVARISFLETVYKRLSSSSSAYESPTR